MASSSIPIVKAALFDLLGDRDGLAGVQLEWAWPGTAKIKDESIFYGDVDMDEAARQLGNGTRKEDYDLPIWVCVKLAGNKPRDAELRAWDLVAEIEEQLQPVNRADLGLGPDDGLKSLTVQFGGVQSSAFTMDAARSHEIKCRLTVSARI